MKLLEEPFGETPRRKKIEEETKGGDNYCQDQCTGPNQLIKMITSCIRSPGGLPYSPPQPHAETGPGGHIPCGGPPDVRDAVVVPRWRTATAACGRVGPDRSPVVRVDHGEGKGRRSRVERGAPYLEPGVRGNRFRHDDAAGGRKARPVGGGDRVRDVLSRGHGRAVRALEQGEVRGSGRGRCPHLVLLRAVSRRGRRHGDPARRGSAVDGPRRDDQKGPLGT